MDVTPESVRLLLLEFARTRSRFDWTKIERLPKEVIPILIAEFKRYKIGDWDEAPPDIALRRYTFARSINWKRLDNRQVVSFWEEWWDDHQHEDRRIWKSRALAKCQALLPRHKARKYWEINYQEFRDIANTLSRIPEGSELLIEAGRIARKLYLDTTEPYWTIWGVQFGKKPPLRFKPGTKYKFLIKPGKPTEYHIPFTILKVWLDDELLYEKDEERETPRRAPIRPR